MLINFKAVGIMILVVLISFCGCALSQSHLKQEREEINKRVLKSAEKATDESIKERLKFLDCVKGYTLRNIKSPVTATELAEAAVSDCELHLMRFESERIMYHSAMGGLTMESIDESTRIENQAQYKARLERQELLDSGKRIAIKTLIETKKQE